MAMKSCRHGMLYCLPLLPPNTWSFYMRTVSPILFGVVVGWAASGVDWTRDAAGEETAPHWDLNVAIA